MSAFLGIDIGTSGTKTVVIDPQGRLLGEAMQEYPCFTPRPLWSEQDPEHWWQATLATIQQAVSQAGIDPQQVKGIGLSGQMHGSVFLDQEHRVIRPAILWNDQRTAQECQEIEQRAGSREELIRLVANPALTGFTAPKILWLRRHEPENYARVRYVLLPKDYIRLRLTGELATDVSDASGTLLLDVARRQWSRELLQRLELPEEWFPRCYESHEPTGTLRPEVARQLGLSPQVVVVAGAGDCAAGAVGNGIVRSGVLSTSIGTSGVMFVHCDQMTVDPQGRVHTFCHAVAGRWHMMGVNLCAGGSLQWFRNQLCLGLAAECAPSGTDPYQLLGAEAARVPPGAQGLVFLPYLSGERTPHADPLARGAFVGLTLAHGRGHLVRAIMEGVTFALRDSLEIFRELRVPVEQIRVSGGGSKSPLWRQIQADVFGQDVVRLVAEQGPAFGVALLAAVGCGEYESIEAACDATIQVAEHIRHDPQATAVYDQVFATYRALYPSLKPHFQAMDRW